MALRRSRGGLSAGGGHCADFKHVFKGLSRGADRQPHQTDFRLAADPRGVAGREPCIGGGGGGAGGVYEGKWQECDCASDVICTPRSACTRFTSISTASKFAGAGRAVTKLRGHRQCWQWASRSWISHRNPRTESEARVEAQRNAVDLDVPALIHVRPVMRR